MRLVGALGIVVLLALLATQAWGHGWYPHECCADYDCAPVTKTESIPGFAYAGVAALGQQPQPPTLWVTTRHGRAAVPQNMIPRQSLDSQPHACIRKGQVVCYFLPPSI